MDFWGPFERQFQQNVHAAAEIAMSPLLGWVE